MADFCMERSRKIADIFSRLIDLAQYHEDTNVAHKLSKDFSTSLEDCLYELTGQLLELFSLEDEYHCSRKQDISRLLLSRRRLSAQLHQLLEAVVSARTCGNKTAGELLEDVESVSAHFRKYRVMSQNLNSLSTHTDSAALNLPQ